MVITILEALVSKENWSVLENAFRSAAEERDAGLVQSFLIQSLKDPEFWRIMTFWSSKEVLDEMRKTVGTPRGVLIFREAKAEPELSIFNVAEQIPLE